MNAQGFIAKIIIVYSFHFWGRFQAESTLHLHPNRQLIEKFKATSLLSFFLQQLLKITDFLREPSQDTWFTIVGYRSFHIGLFSSIRI